MTAVIDFIRAALPWIAIGFFLAVMASEHNMKKEGRSASTAFKVGKMFPSLAFLVVATMEWADGDGSSAGTYCILALTFALLGYKNKVKEA